MLSESPYTNLSSMQANKAKLQISISSMKNLQKGEHLRTRSDEPKHLKTENTISSNDGGRNRSY